MKHRFFIFVCALFLSALLIGLISCSEDPNYDIEDNFLSPDTTQNEIQPGVLDTLDTSTCDTANYTYSAFVVPLIQDNKCLDCHTGSEPRGGVFLGSYSGVKEVADEGRLLGALSWAGGYEAMPQGEEQLPACDIYKIKLWVDAGAPNN